MRVWVLAMILAGCPAAGLPVDGPPIAVGPFSSMAAGGLPTGWAPMTFPKIDAHSRYRLVDMAGRTVLRADSEASASGLIKKIDVDPQTYPWLTWTWRVSNVLAAGDVTQKAGDDYPARIYVTFAEDAEQQSLIERAQRAAVKLLYGQAPPSAALAYIWANRAPVGSIHPNAFTDRCQMIVVDSGSTHVHEWRGAQRNIVDDFRRAFGVDPPPITGIAVMTDTDNTAESATAWFGDIVLQQRPRE